MYICIYIYSKLLSLLALISYTELYIYVSQGFNIGHIINSHNKRFKQAKTSYVIKVIVDNKITDTMTTREMESVQ